MGYAGDETPSEAGASMYEVVGNLPGEGRTSATGGLRRNVVVEPRGRSGCDDSSALSLEEGGGGVGVRAMVTTWH